eukprot:6195651-Pleurochrysis_carterae.AAC.1
MRASSLGKARRRAHSPGHAPVTSRARSSDTSRRIRLRARTHSHNSEHGNPQRVFVTRDPSSSSLLLQKAFSPLLQIGSPCHGAFHTPFCMHALPHALHHLLDSPSRRLLLTHSPPSSLIAFGPSATNL